MRRIVRNTLIGAAVFLIVFIAGTLIAVETRSRRTFAASYPAIGASPDPAIVERGRYLVYGPAACAYCHVPREDWVRLDQGHELPLAGNHLFRLPFGEIYSSNLTPDANTGIGRRTDGELARVLRHGVLADGRAALPLMEYQGLSDEDLTAIVSFLRSKASVSSAVPAHRLSLLGKAIMGFAYEPERPQQIRATSPRGVSIERGDYLANRVSVCVSCHTNRDERSGSLVGPRFAGGQRLDVAADSSKVYVAPNLTPDEKTSVIGRWTEAVFVARFRQGELIEGTPMPWGAYGRMTDDDLRSTFRYLKSLPPVENATGPIIQPKD